jgi:hypothetical protein
MLRRPAWPILSLSLLLGGVASAAEPSAGPAPVTERKIEVKVEKPARAGDLARVKTSAGTFLVNEKNIDLLRKTLAGEPTTHEIWAGGTD